MKIGKQQQQQLTTTTRAGDMNGMLGAYRSNVLGLLLAAPPLTNCLVPIEARTD